jgi:hypothetical protein
MDASCAGPKCVPLVRFNFRVPITYHRQYPLLQVESENPCSYGAEGLHARRACITSVRSTARYLSHRHYLPFEVKGELCSYQAESPQSIGRGPQPMKYRTHSHWAPCSFNLRLSIAYHTANVRSSSGEREGLHRDKPDAFVLGPSTSGSMMYHTANIRSSKWRARTSAAT